MELRHLCHFVAVAEHLSFTKAAGKLHLAQPSLTRQIHNLEEERAKEGLRCFIDAAKQEHLDFIIQLGDFCRPYEKNRGFLDIWEEFPGPPYHTLGNRDRWRKVAASLSGHHHIDFATQTNGFYYLQINSRLVPWIWDRILRMNSQADATQP